MLTVRRKNSTEAQRVSTRLNTSQNIYVYRPLDLYIAYGSSILCTFMCISLGCFAILHNGVSYNGNFSTIMRTTRKQEINDLGSVSDSRGADPLPSDIAKTEIRFAAMATGDDGLSGFIVCGTSQPRIKTNE